MKKSLIVLLMWQVFPCAWHDQVQASQKGKEGEMALQGAQPSVAYKEIFARDLEVMKEEALKVFRGHSRLEAFKACFLLYVEKLDLFNKKTSHENPKKIIMEKMKIFVQKLQNMAGIFKEIESTACHKVAPWLKPMGVYKGAHLPERFLHETADEKLAPLYDDGDFQGVPLFEQVRFYNGDLSKRFLLWHRGPWLKSLHLYSPEKLSQISREEEGVDQIFLLKSIFLDFQNVVVKNMGDEDIVDQAQNIFKKRPNCEQKYFGNNHVSQWAIKGPNVLKSFLGRSVSDILFDAKDFICRNKKIPKDKNNEYNPSLMWEFWQNTIWFFRVSELFADSFYKRKYQEAFDIILEKIIYSELNFDFLLKELQKLKENCLQAMEEGQLEFKNFKLIEKEFMSGKSGKWFALQFFQKHPIDLQKEILRKEDLSSNKRDFLQKQVQNQISIHEKALCSLEKSKKKLDKMLKGNGYESLRGYDGFKSFCGHIYKTCSHIYKTLSFNVRGAPESLLQELASPQELERHTAALENLGRYVGFLLGFHALRERHEGNKDILCTYVGGEKKSSLEKDFQSLENRFNVFQNMCAAFAGDAFLITKRADRYQKDFSYEVEELAYGRVRILNKVWKVDTFDAMVQELALEEGCSALEKKMWPTVAPSMIQDGQKILEAISQGINRLPQASQKESWERKLHELSLRLAACGDAYVGPEAIPEGEEKDPEALLKLEKVLFEIKALEEATGQVMKNSYGEEALREDVEDMNICNVDKYMENFNVDKDMGSSQEDSQSSDEDVRPSLLEKFQKEVSWSLRWVELLGDSKHKQDYQEKIRSFIKHGMEGDYRVAWKGLIKNKNEYLKKIGTGSLENPDLMVQNIPSPSPAKKQGEEGHGSFQVLDQAFLEAQVQDQMAMHEKAVKRLQENITMLGALWEDRNYKALSRDDDFKDSCISIYEACKKSCASMYGCASWEELNFCFETSSPQELEYGAASLGVLVDCCRCVLGFGALRDRHRFFCNLRQDATWQNMKSQEKLALEGKFQSWEKRFEVLENNYASFESHGLKKVLEVTKDVFCNVEKFGPGKRLDLKFEEDGNVHDMVQKMSMLEEEYGALEKKMWCTVGHSMLEQGKERIQEISEGIKYLQPGSQKESWEVKSRHLFDMLHQSYDSYIKQDKIFCNQQKCKNEKVKFEKALDDIAQLQNDLLMEVNQEKLGKKPQDHSTQELDKRFHTIVQQAKEIGFSLGKSLTSNLMEDCLISLEDIKSFSAFKTEQKYIKHRIDVLKAQVEGLEFLAKDHGAWYQEKLTFYEKEAEACYEKLLNMREAVENFTQKLLKNPFLEKISGYENTRSNHRAFVDLMVKKEDALAGILAEGNDNLLYLIEQEDFSALQEADKLLNDFFTNTCCFALENPSLSSKVKQNNLLNENLQGLFAMKNGLDKSLWDIQKKMLKFFSMKEAGHDQNGFDFVQKFLDQDAQCDLFSEKLDEFEHCFSKNPAKGEEAPFAESLKLFSSIKKDFLTFKEDISENTYKKNCEEMENLEKRLRLCHEILQTKGQYWAEVARAPSQNLDARFQDKLS